MNITPEEFIEMQYKAARDAVASVTRVPALGSIKCGVRGDVWLDETDSMIRGRAVFKLAGTTSTVEVECSVGSEDPGAEVRRVESEIRARIEREVMVAFDEFIYAFIDRMAKARSASRSRKGAAR